MKKKKFTLDQHDISQLKIVWLLNFPPAANRQVPLINSHTKEIEKIQRVVEKNVIALKTNNINQV